MSVDILSPVDATAAKLRPAQQNAINAIAEPEWQEERRLPVDPRQSNTDYQAETVVRLREARDLNRARIRRLIAMLRKLQANPPQSIGGGEAIDQRMSQLLERAATQAAGAKTQYVNTERAQLAAMRELSQMNAKRLLTTHFRRNLVQVTASKGVIVVLAILAGTGLLTASYAAQPAEIYPAILCFALAVAWGWRYLAAILAPLRRRALCGSDWRASISAPPILADETASMSLGLSSTASSDKCTVADLLAEWRTTPTTETLRF